MSTEPPNNAMQTDGRSAAAADRLTVRPRLGELLLNGDILTFTTYHLLIACIVPAVYGVHLLRTQGKPDARRPHDAPLLWIEKTTQLVTTGVFKYIRHPLYSSLLLLAWGVFFKRPSWVGVGAVLGATVLLLATAKVEEVENIRYFGAEYRAYMQHSKMFIPLVF